MNRRRRTLLAAASCLPGWPAIARAASPFEVYEQATGGRIGVHAENVATGAKVSWRADERFVMCSTFKASLAALALARIDAGLDTLDSRVAFDASDLQPYAPAARDRLALGTGTMSVGEMCAAAVELSDNTCANVLLRRVGGPSALTAFWRQSGDAVSRLDHNEPMLNRTPLGQSQDTTTPAAMAGNLRRFVLGDVLTSTSRASLTRWMVECKTGGDRLRAGLPGNWRVADKTGNNGSDAFGDIAVAWPRADTPILICAYTRGGSANARQVEAVFAQIGQLVARRLA